MSCKSYLAATEGTSIGFGRKIESHTNHTIDFENSLAFWQNYFSHARFQMNFLCYSCFAGMLLFLLCVCVDMWSSCRFVFEPNCLPCLSTFICFLMCTCTYICMCATARTHICTYVYGRVSIFGFSFNEKHK